VITKSNTTRIPRSYSNAAPSKTCFSCRDFPPARLRVPPPVVERKWPRNLLNLEAGQTLRAISTALARGCFVRSRPRQSAGEADEVGAPPESTWPTAVRAAFRTRLTPSFQISPPVMASQSLCPHEFDYLLVPTFANTSLDAPKLQLPRNLGNPRSPPPADPSVWPQPHATQLGLVSTPKYPRASDIYTSSASGAGIKPCAFPKVIRKKWCVNRAGLLAGRFTLGRRDWGPRRRWSTFPITISSHSLGVCDRVASHSGQTYPVAALKKVVPSS